MAAGGRSPGSQVNDISYPGAYGGPSALPGGPLCFAPDNTPGPTRQNGQSPSQNGLPCCVVYSGNAWPDLVPCHHLLGKIFHHFTCGGHRRKYGEFFQPGLFRTTNVVDQLLGLTD